MRHIDKGSEPEYLTEHKEQWLRTFIESGKPRPDSKKYAHQHIVDALKNVSYCKCFYCECSLSTEKAEVDHFIEVSEKKELAFEWNNLNLSCNWCNRHKRPNKDIPIADVLDPCKDSDEEIQNCITFDGEVMHEVNNSDKGRFTIQKYDLNSDEQVYKRGKYLSSLILAIFPRVKCGGVKSLTDAEKEQIRSFSYPTRPFSYMVENNFLKFSTNL